MKLKASVVALPLALAAVLALGAPAFADDGDHPKPGATGFPHEHRERPEENELHERYGEDVGQVNLPPLVVKEGPKTGAAGANTGELIPAGKPALVDAGKADPQANLPIDPKSINPREGTPADSFFQSATVGLGVMGAGVAVLGGFAIRRTVRMRKDPKADFLYQ